MDLASGTLGNPVSVADVERPTWVLADPGRSVLYAVSEVGNAGDREASVSSFAIDRVAGTLRPIGSVSSGGCGATHLTMSARGDTLFVANFGDGHVAALPIGADGRLGEAASRVRTDGIGPHRRQQGPHPHGVTIDPTGRFLLVPDMGADRVFVYRFDPDVRTLTPAEPAFVAVAAGSGPRYVVFGNNGRYAYLLNELSSEIDQFAWDADRGRLSHVVKTVIDAVGTEGTRSAAALCLSHGRRHLYVSNRLTDMIHVYAIDRSSGRLQEVQRIASGGIRPWAAELSPDGRWLIVANQGSDRVTVFAVTETSGRLTPTAASLAVPKPTAISFA